MDLVTDRERICLDTESLAGKKKDEVIETESAWMSERAGGYSEDLCSAVSHF